MTTPNAGSSWPDWLASLPASNRKALIDALPADVIRLILSDWRGWAGPAQRPGDGDWTTWLFLGGRGAGKTRAGAEWLSEQALSGLLRGQRGTETEAEAGIDAGTLSVVLDDAVVRPDARPGELNLTTEWRAAPVGRMPSGPEAASTAFVWSGRARRPMRPCHLRRADVVGGGWAFNWIPRDPGDLDGWGEPDRPSTGRFRLRLNDGEADRLMVEREGAAATISAAQMAEAFPAGAGPDARAFVAQFDPVGGWGPEAEIRL